jgi:hypothetical protein
MLADVGVVPDDVGTGQTIKNGYRVMWAGPRTPALQRLRCRPARSGRTLPCTGICALPSLLPPAPWAPTWWA